MTLPRRWYYYALGALLVGVLLALVVRRLRRPAQAVTTSAGKTQATGASALGLEADIYSLLPPSTPEVMAWKTAVPQTAPPEDRAKLWLLSMKGESNPDPTAFGAL